MPQIQNTISTEDIRFALDMEMIENFQHDQDRWPRSWASSLRRS